MDDKWKGLDEFKEALHMHGLRRNQSACDALESWWLESYVPMRGRVTELEAAGDRLRAALVREGVPHAGVLIIESLPDQRGDGENDDG